MKIIRKIFTAGFLCLGFISCRNLNPFYSNADVNNRIEKLLEIKKDDFVNDDTYTNGEAEQAFYNFLNETPSSYNVLILTDIHVGKNGVNSEKQAARLDAYLTDLDALGKTPVFCVNLGDVTNKGYRGQYINVEKYIKPVLAKHKIKFLSVVGNHDIFNEGYEIWKVNLYPYTSFYKFETEKSAFYFLDTGSGVIGEKQHSLLQKDLSTQEKDLYVFAHYPITADDSFLFAMRDTTDRNKLISILGKEKVIGYYCGHWHFGNTRTIGNFIQYCLESFGTNNMWYVVNVDESAHQQTIESIKQHQ